MNVALRMRIGSVLALVVAGLTLAVAVALLGALGVQPPRTLAGTLSSAGAALVVVRVLLTARLALSVARAREDS
jgi:hypothetical protein